LSPAAKRVLEAFLSYFPDEPLKQDIRCLSLAIRSVVEQTKVERLICYDSLLTEDVIDPDDILAIADELEIYDG
jgi:hypothetical protein